MTIITEAEPVGRGHADVRVWCETCGETFEQRETVAEHEAAKPKCPKCGSDKVERAVSTFYAQTSRKS
jgi:putative FmdB family regulatory protein